MRQLLILSVLSFSLTSCYIEVTDQHTHDNGHSNQENQYPSNYPFQTFNINRNMTYDDATRLSSYALHLYSISNQPHQLAFLNHSDNLLNDSVLAQNLIVGDTLGITNNDINDRNLANTCNYGYLDITDYQSRNFENYYSNGELFDEFDANFSLHTSPECEYRLTNTNLNPPLISLNGSLNYDIFFKNFISNSNQVATDELISKVSGNWSVENDALGYWDILNFTSQSNYHRFDDNIVWTKFSSNLEIHDHSRELNSQLKISTNNFIQTELGVIHPYSGQIFIEDSSTNNRLSIMMYSNSVDIYLNGQILYSTISWDTIIDTQTYFGLL